MMTATTWAPPTPEPCPFRHAYSGPCGHTNRTHCNHPTRPCTCGRPALTECHWAESLMCGNPLCQPGTCHLHGGPPCWNHR